MDDAVIICPECHAEIPLTETLTAPILAAERAKYRQYHEQEMAKLRDAVGTREAAVRRKEEELAKAQAAIDDQVEARTREERVKIAEQEAAKARLLVQDDLAAQSGEIQALKDALEKRNEKLVKAQEAEAELLRKQRELEDEKAALAVTVERRLSEEREGLREKAKREADEAWQLKDRENKHLMEQMQKKIEELQKKAEQGSQQLQGEVLELHLEELLRREFPLDGFRAVPKGESGADLLQTVHTTGGAVAGSILWEIKRTRAWSDGWLPKLRADQRVANADLAIIVSETLPKGIEYFDEKDRVCVTATSCVLPVAVQLRERLICVAAARRTSEGQFTKQELLYDYLTGPRFAHRVRAIVEHFTEMEEDLRREQRLMNKQWAKREQQIRSIMQTTAGMYGDVQGIAGQSVQEVEGLSIDLIAGPEGDVSEKSIDPSER